MVYNNSEIYKEPIGKVVSVSEKISKNNQEQKITIRLVNTKSKGKIISLTNIYDNSLVYDEKYHKGDMLFLSNDHKHPVSVKRDYQIAGATLLLFAILIILGGGQGLLTSLCFVINVLLFYGMTRLYVAGYDILWLSIGCCFIFTFLVLLLINGWNRRLIMSFVATCSATFVVGLIAFVLIWFSKDIGYNYLDFLPEPYTKIQANHFFLAQIIISGLGAVIDVSVTITATTTELLHKSPDLSMKQLRKSIGSVADDITGTMINVLFFTNLAAIIPVAMVSMANDVRFLTVMKYNGYFDVARFLAGAIAVLITIPISAYVASLFSKEKKGGRAGRSTGKEKLC